MCPAPLDDDAAIVRGMSVDRRSEAGRNLEQSARRSFRPDAPKRAELLRLPRRLVEVWDFIRRHIDVVESEDAEGDSDDDGESGEAKLSVHVRFSQRWTSRVGVAVRAPLIGHSITNRPSAPEVSRRERSSGTPLPAMLRKAGKFVPT